MRKPLVVVCATATALLLGGGVAATSAAADERPDTAGWGGFWWPDLFGGSGADSDDDAFEEPFADRGDAERPTLDAPPGDTRADGAQADGTHADGAQADGTHARPGAAPQDDRGRSAQDDAADQRSNAAQRGAATGDGAAQRGGAAQSDGADRQRPATAQRPHAAQAPVRRPGFAGQRQPGFAAQQRQPAGNVMAGARQPVTTSDVSASPHAPVQQRVLVLINQNRRRGGCDPLTLDRRLIAAAYRHAADMARRDYFAHESPNGDDAGERVSEAGYEWKRYGENIARGADSAWEVVDGWMNSPTHRENIMDCRLHQMGIGLAISRDRTPYWVQDFATPDR
ncbi:CAP domain-containing protein [Actinoplanes solisilvae]|uniref:CAP domain-containing protein n=1 Tax=Actinoplanes solisilvae TaxID=2486853 RepID=UPI000FDC5DE8|nr:CAP domain-containing protein [Actinoplanes solisilvae]